MRHYVRDVVFGEGASRTRSAYGAMAAVRNVVVGILHLHQVPNFAAQLRACHRDPYQLPMQLILQVPWLRGTETGGTARGLCAVLACLGMVSGRLAGATEAIAGFGLLVFSPT
jgi:hypothetical protein